MVSSLLSCWPVRVRLASRPGLLLLLGEGNDGDDEDGEAENKNLQTDADDGQDALLSADASSEHEEEKGFVPSEAERDLQPQVGQPGEGLLLPSPGDEADIDLQPEIKGHNQYGVGFLLPSQGDVETDLADEGFALATDEKGLIPVAASEGAGPAPYGGDLPLLSACGTPFDLEDDAESAIADDDRAASADDGALCPASADDGAPSPAHADYATFDAAEADDHAVPDDYGFDTVLMAETGFVNSNFAGKFCLDPAHTKDFHAAEDNSKSSTPPIAPEGESNHDGDAAGDTTGLDSIADANTGPNDDDADFDDCNDYESGDAEHADVVVAVSFTEPVDDDCASASTTDAFDADFAEDATAADAYASITDAEAHVAHADESDAKEHTAEDDFAADFFEEAASTDPDEDHLESATLDEDVASEDPDEDDEVNSCVDAFEIVDGPASEGALQPNIDVHDHLQRSIDGDFSPFSVAKSQAACAQKQVYDDAIIMQVLPRVDPKVKKKTSLLLCITINMPFHPGEHVVSHETAAGHAPREGEDHVHVDHVSQDEADSQDVRVHDVCRFQDPAHPVVILADCSHDGMVLVAKAGTLSMYLPFPILRGSKGIYQDSEKQIEVPAKLVYAGSKKIALFTINAPFDPG